jgi:hypothetical protein
MTTYNELAGFRVNYLSTDPTLNSGNEGQVWYNSTSGTLKALVQIRSWGTGGNLNTARYILAGAGTQTEGLAMGGDTTVVQNVTEEYNGTNWTAGGNLGTARRELAGCGTQTVGLAFGGYTGTSSNATEEYNGTSWTAGGNLGTARFGLAGAGTQTVGLGFAGYASTAVTAATEEYDGSAWTAGGNMNTASSRTWIWRSNNSQSVRDRRI